MLASVLPFFGMGLIAFACLAFARNFGEPAQRSVILPLLIVVAAGLVIFSDKEISDFKCNPKDGCGFSRKGASDQEAMRGTIKAELDTRLDAQNKVLETKFQAINSAIAAVKSAGAGATLNLPSTTVTAAPVKDKGTVLVFYRDAQVDRATRIVEGLKKAGYKSSATNSDLREVTQWTKSSAPNFVEIAVTGTNDELTKDLSKTVLSLTKDSGSKLVDPSPSLFQIDQGWSFKSSVAQIYLF